MSEQTTARWPKRGAWAFAFLLLAALIVPKVDYGFKKTRAKQQEAALPELLNALRSALESFHKRHHSFPDNLRNPDFLKELGTAEAGLPAGSPGYSFDKEGVPIIDLSFKLGHKASSEVEAYDFVSRNGQVDATRLRDTGHWLYDHRTGRLLIDCTHKAAVARWAPLGEHPIYEW